MSSPLAHRLRSVVAAAAAPVAFALAAAAVGVSPAAADVKLPAVLSDSMVLQQGQPVPVWGWADKGEQVTVTFGDQTLVTTAGDDGKWRVKLRPLTASDKPAELTVSGKNKLALKDVLVGEVWVCSGQSNMEFVVNNAKDSKKEIVAAEFPTIRLFTVPKTIKLEPVDDTKANWVACSPKTVGNFSAVGYFFGRELNQQLKVPVGLIHTSWGGTPAEAWTREEDFAKDADLAPIPDGYKKTAQTYEARKANYEKALAKYKETEKEAKEAAKAAGKPAPQAPRAPGAPDKDPNRPTVLYNGMIAPIVPFAAKGAIWYQGESNAGRAYQYRKLLPTMIDGWRAAWGDKDYKFLIVQLANFQNPAKTPGDDAWAELREAQTMTANLPNNGQALAIDLADADNPGDIHPKNKQDVGKRLALVALGKYYGKKDVVYAGPTYSEHKITGDKVVITLDSAVGLRASGHDENEKVTGFQIAGADKKWHWADAKIDGKSVVVSSPEVKEPKAVRYAWSTNPVANLYNAAGLPAAPFRTDDWPGVTQPKAAAEKAEAKTAEPKK
jgi:sialate O-acetylesterase